MGIISNGVIPFFMLLLQKMGSETPPNTQKLDK